MIFFGCYRNSLDEKKRVVVPAKFRETAGDEGREFVVTTMQGDCLSVYTRSVWEQITRELNSRAFPDADTLDLMTLLFTQAEDVVCDKQGRIMLRQAESVGINNEAVIVGIANHIQIWAPDAYDAKMNALRPRSRELLDGIGD